MLRCNPICQLPLPVQGLSQQNRTSSVKAGVSDLPSLQRGELFSQFLHYISSECLRGGDQDGQRHLIMFGLGDQVSSHKGRGGSSIRDDHNLARPGHHIDIYGSIDQSLGCCYIPIPRSNNLIHFGNRCSSRRRGLQWPERLRFDRSRSTPAKSAATSTVGSIPSL